MTDYDGTLVPVKERPEYALPGPDLLRVLRRLAQKRRITLAVVSGRNVAELKSLVPVPGIYLVGCHGAEYVYPGGGQFTAVDTEKLAPVLDLVADEAVRCVADGEGFLLEHKKMSFALHYRLADPVRALQVAGDFVTAVRPLVAKYDLQIIAGKKVIEVCPRTAHKGEAVRRLMALHPGFFPVYLGDDIPDEDAFRAVQGKGLGVLVSGYKKLTAASYRFQDPHDVLRFLQILSARC